MQEDPDAELENYSINDRDETSFTAQLYQLTRKKILMQLRDKKTLFIDIFFPILLIIVGLELATIAVIKSGPDRPLQPYDLYKEFDISNKFYYNSASSDADLKTEDISSFIQDMVSLDTDMFSMGEAIQMDIKDAET